MRKLIQILYKIKIFKRIIPSFLKIFIKIFSIKEIIVNHNDKLFYLNLNNPIDREIYLKGNYENEQIDFLASLIRKNNIEFFLDVGAHMGFYSINIFKNNVKIFSFEPEKNNFNQLEKNKNLNNAINISLHNIALSNEKKKIKMWVPDKNKTGGYSVHTNDDEEKRKYAQKNIFEIDSFSDLGDNIINLSDKKIAMKIDVERHEKNVLEGMSLLLSKNKVTMQIELFDSKKNDIIVYLDKIGFKHFHTIKKDYYFTNY